MTAIWHFYWPVFVLATIAGLVAGVSQFRKPRGQRNYPLLAGAAVAAVAVGYLWHGPGGAGQRLAVSVERGARIALDNYEMTQVSVKLERGPLSRTLVLSGPADDFQQRQMIQILRQVPGAGRVRWDRPLAPSRGL